MITDNNKLALRVQYVFSAIFWRARGMKLDLRKPPKIRRKVRIINPQNIEIGWRCVVRPNCVINAGPNATIKFGKRGGVTEFCYVNAVERIEVGDESGFAPGCHVTDANHNFGSLDVNMIDQGRTASPIIIGNDVWVAAGCKILSGVEIRDHAIVAAGSVVTRGIVPEGAIVAGIPARIVKWRDDSFREKAEADGLVPAAT